MIRSWQSIVILSISLLAGLSACAKAATNDATVRYSRDIKPILSNNCYACHGPDEAKRKAKVRFDQPEGAVAELRGGRHAIVSGDLAKSTLIQRINTTDEDDIMPPVKTGKHLTPEQKDLLKRWIEQGAKFDKHWSYVAATRPAEPEVKDQVWSKSPIDKFVQSRLEAEKLPHSAEADRRTLLRRLSFDLTGLPPTPQEVRAFEQDQSADAIEKQVDRLLASPQYGERMAVYWLDLVRYGDSKGYHSDNPISVWPFRDYVIHAFNDNKPFDVFTIEQLAGDLVPDSKEEQKIASGYNRLNLHTEEGGAQPKEYLAKYFADRVRNVSTAWMGASMGCCECHDHKFDPYKTREFYGFGAFFADISEVAVGVQPPGLRLPTGTQTAELQRINRQITPLERAYNADTPELTAAQAEWEKEVKAQADLKWQELEPLVFSSSSGATMVREGNIVLSAGTRPDKDKYVVSFYTDATNITGFRLETLPHSSSPGEGPGRADNGNFVLNEFSVSVAPASDPARIQRVKLQNASADFSQSQFEIANAIDGKPQTGWAILPEVAKAHNAVFETKTPVGAPGGTVLTVTMDQSFGGGHLIGYFRISIISDPNPSKHNSPNSIPQEIRGFVATDAAKRTPEQKTAIRDHFRSMTPLLKPIRDRLAELRTKRDEVERGVATMLISESVKPRDIRVLPRGNWMDDSGEIVQPNVPAFLPKIDVKDRRLTRLDLANWMVSPDHPLVARVFVNRLWYLFFGQGIVKTLDDFGSQGAWPTNPELLDWLATEFVASGWDVKHMVRLITTSRAYRQSSKPTPQQLQKDPGNQLFARQGRFRLDAEFVRDNVLDVSGLLSPKIGGPSVKPYQPAGFWAFLNFPLRDWVADKGENQYRRGLYTWVQRTMPHPSPIAFDGSSREECMVERPRSNTPLQALVLLNDPSYVEAARVFAAKMLRDTAGKDVAQRLSYVFESTLQRPPSQKETEVLVALCSKHMKEFEQDKPAAEALLKVGNAAVPAGANVAELAAWTSVTRTVLNLHETITRN